MRRTPASTSDDHASAYCAIARLVRAGEWTTYGDIAAAVHGRRGYARAVARTAALDHRFPNAHRVLRSDGSVTRPGGDERVAAVIARLESEGIVFGAGRADAARRVFFDELQRRAGLDARFSPRQR